MKEGNGRGEEHEVPKQNIFLCCMLLKSKNGSGRT